MDKETMTCPYCGEEILAKAKKCKHCGELLDGASNLSNDMKKCPFCKEMIPINSTFCNICETPLADIQTNVIPKIEYKSTITQSVDNSIIPDNVKRFNWGAFWFSWIWGIANKSYKTFWTLIPFFGIIWLFVCGIKGNEWAWKNKQWYSVEEFNSTQKIWAIIGNCLAIFLLLLTTILFITMKSISNDYTNNSPQTTQELNSDTVIEQRGDIIDTYTDEYNYPEKESPQKVQSSKKIQQPVQPKSQVTTPTNAVVPQIKPIQVQQHNNEIDDFMN